MDQTHLAASLRLPSGRVEVTVDDVLHVALDPCFREESPEGDTLAGQSVQAGFRARGLEHVAVERHLCRGCCPF